MAVTLSAAACDTGSHHSGMPSTEHGSMAPASPGDTGMPGMGDMPAGDGLAASASGFTFAPARVSLAAGKPESFSFQIRGSNGRPDTAFVDDQTKLMHFYLIRSDLTGFQHLHPTMAGDGTWTVPVAALQPGSYRAYAAFITRYTAAGKQIPLILSEALTVPGTASPAPLPAPATTTKVDGYTVRVGGQLMVGMTRTLTVTISRNGTPVTDLQPYLATYAHLTAFHDGDLAFAHLHPQGSVNGDHGGPSLTFEAMLPKAGNWRLFLQFQTGGSLHTAAITLTVGS